MFDFDQTSFLNSRGSTSRSRLSERDAPPNNSSANSERDRDNFSRWRDRQYFGPRRWLETALRDTALEKDAGNCFRVVSKTKKTLNCTCCRKQEEGRRESFVDIGRAGILAGFSWSFYANSDFIQRTHRSIQHGTSLSMEMERPRTVQTPRRKSVNTRIPPLPLNATFLFFNRIQTFIIRRWCSWGCWEKKFTCSPRVRLVVPLLPNQEKWLLGLTIF